MKPSVSICITCYNQREYIAESVRSALCQEYDPLEVVICDDCSSDGTDEIVAKLIAEYQKTGGRHSVRFLRNQKNLNVAKNYEKCFSLATGEVLITGAGDDMSLSDRAQKIAECFAENGCPSIIFHGGDKIDVHGKVIGVLEGHHPWFPLGASTAYARQVFHTFPEIEFAKAYEDWIFALRAILIGRSIEIDDRLMLYRIGSGISTCAKTKNYVQKVHARNQDTYLQMLKDLDFAGQNGMSEHCAEYKCKVNELLNYDIHLQRLEFGESFAERIDGFVYLFLHGKLNFVSIATWLTYLVFADCAWSVIQKVKNCVQ